jgi:hypothetical protein
MQIDKNEYGSYYRSYIDLVNGIPLDDLWIIGSTDLFILMDNLTNEEALTRYQKDKWSVKEVFGHMMDTERIFCYRALALARGEEVIKGYNHNAYLDQAGFNRFSLSDLKEQYRITKEYSESIFSSFTDRELLRKGTVNNVPFSVRAVAYVIAGHEQHHLQILAKKYLPAITKPEQ